MIKGIGTDIVDLHRFKDKDERFIKRILSDKEYTFYETITNNQRKLTYLGGRFAAKEALFKAISKADGSTNYHDFSILNNEDGKPFLDSKPKYLNEVIVHLSISHTDVFAIAYVILEIR